MFVFFDILQVPSGCIAPICIPLAMGLMWSFHLLVLTMWLSTKH